MKFDYGKVADYALQIESIRNIMLRQVDDVRDIISNLNSNWSGVASDNYIKQARMYFDNLTEFVDELNACIAFLRKSSDEYEKLDKNVQQELSNIISKSRIFN